MRTKLSERQPESIRVGSCRIKLGRGRGGACFGEMRRDGEKDGSDPILTRRHFAERLDGTGKM